MKVVSPLFTPFILNRLTLRNRWVMPAMQRGMCVGGAPKPELAAYYRRRAEGGVPLIIGESGAVDHPSSTVQPTSAHINAGTRDAWARCVSAVRGLIERRSPIATLLNPCAASWRISRSRAVRSS